MAASGLEASEQSGMEEKELGGVSEKAEVKDEVSDLWKEEERGIH